MPDLRAAVPAEACVGMANFMVALVAASYDTGTSTWPHSIGPHGNQVDSFGATDVVVVDGWAFSVLCEQPTNDTTAKKARAPTRRRGIRVIDATLREQRTTQCSTPLEHQTR